MGEVAQVELAEDTIIKFEMQTALDDLQNTMDEDDILHTDLLNLAQEGSY